MEIKIHRLNAARRPAAPGPNCRLSIVRARLSRFIVRHGYRATRQPIPSNHLTGRLIRLAVQRAVGSSNAISAPSRGYARDKEKHCPGVLQLLRDNRVDRYVPSTETNCVSVGDASAGLRCSLVHIQSRLRYKLVLGPLAVY